MEDKKVFQTALETWGPNAQTVMVFEEMSELQKELCKHARGKENAEQIAEEIADVQNNCEKAVKEYRRSKIERLKIRFGIAD